MNEHYSTSADMWSLGAVISFYCNRDHLFTDVDSVFEWKGGSSSLDRRYYSGSLRGLVASLMLPNANRRPTAQRVLEESKKGNRTRLEELPVTM